LEEEVVREDLNELDELDYSLKALNAREIQEAEEETLTKLGTFTRKEQQSSLLILSKVHPYSPCRNNLF